MAWLTTNDEPGRGRFQKAGRRWPVTVVTCLAVAAFMALLVAPEDGVQGDAQRFMYIHVPAAWTAYVCFAMVLVSSVAYLRTRNLEWDRRACAFAQVGVVLTALTLVTGGIWGQLTWGTWWTWDARLVSTSGLLLVYVAHLAIRHVAADDGQGARSAAIVGTGGFLMVPVVHFSVLWWRTLHQPPTILGPSTTPPIDPVMAVTLAVAVVAVMATAGWAARWRYARLDRGRDAPRHAREDMSLTACEDRS